MPAVGRWSSSPISQGSRGHRSAGRVLARVAQGTACPRAAQDEQHARKTTDLAPLFDPPQASPRTRLSQGGERACNQLPVLPGPERAQGCYADDVHKRGWLAKVGLALAWSFISVLVLGVVDALARFGDPMGGSGWFLALAALVAAATFTLSQLVGLPAARAVSLGSLPCLAALVPCAARLADSPLAPELAPDLTPLHAGPIRLAVGLVTFGLVLAVQHQLERSAPRAPGDEALRVDRRLVAQVVVLGLLGCPLFVSRVRLPELHAVAAKREYLEVVVPMLDAAADGTSSVVDDEAVAVTAVRTHSLPLQIARLEIDLRDGLGARRSIAVGGGERLRLAHRAQLVWELCHVTTKRWGGSGARNTGESCVPAARFMRGSASGTIDPRVSQLRGQIAPPPGFLLMAAVAFAAALAALVVSERSRRLLLRISRGQQGMLRADGTVEAQGQSYALRTPPRHGWPGPVVLLGAADAADPYRGKRTADSVEPGTIEQHVAWRAQRRGLLHLTVDVASLLVILSLGTAGFVGYWGF